MLAGGGSYHRGCLVSDHKGPRHRLRNSDPRESLAVRLTLLPSANARRSTSSVGMHHFVAFQNLDVVRAFKGARIAVGALAHTALHLAD